MTMNFTDGINLNAERSVGITRVVSAKQGAGWFPFKTWTEPNHYWSVEISRKFQTNLEKNLKFFLKKLEKNFEKIRKQIRWTRRNI